MKMVFLPELSDVQRAWVAALSEAHPDVEFDTPGSRADALLTLPTADAVFGTLDAELLDAASQLRWLQAPFAAPPAGFYFPGLIEHRVTVTNFRGIYNDHISYHILGMMLSFTKHLHVYRDQQRERVWRPLSGGLYNSIYLPDTTALIVGAGGIGQVLAATFSRYDYDFSLAILITIVSLVFVGEIFSNWVRGYLR